MPVGFRIQLPFRRDCPNLSQRASGGVSASPLFDRRRRLSPYTAIIDRRCRLSPYTALIDRRRRLSPYTALIDRRRRLSPYTA
ncbi:hypothetical protein AAEY33_24805 [Peribacillus simplex]|uniref:hypothetical protein n=1 Tax=Peribacillus simplex TaxID=1478 RepID=UPI003263A6FD